MTALAAVLIAIAAWWLATGVVIVLARQGDSRPGMVVAFMTGLAGLGLLGLHATFETETQASAYVAFFSALSLWAWHETTFLIGLVTGPRRVGAGELPRETSRFRAAFLTVRDHELALFATGSLMLLALYDAANTTGLLIFILLWAMRISTKLNIFLGARHAISDMLPLRLAYLKSYFRTDRTSRWFYLSLALTSALLALLVHRTATAPDPHGTVEAALLATFAGLALLEHLFLALPVRDSALWSWAMAKNGGTERQDRVQAAALTTDTHVETASAAAQA